MILQPAGDFSARPGPELTSVGHLPCDPDAAAGIVLRGGSLRRRRAITETGLQLQVFAQIDVHLDLAGAISRLRCGQVYPLRDVLSGRDACAARRTSAARRSTTWRGSAADRERVEAKPLLDPRERIPLAAASAASAGSYAAQARERGTGLGELQSREL